MVRILEDLAQDWRRLDDRIEAVSGENRSTLQEHGALSALDDNTANRSDHLERRRRRDRPFEGLSENEIGRARLSMMARNTNVPFKGRIQKRKTQYLQIITVGLQRAAGPYRWATSGTRQSRPALKFEKGCVDTQRV